MKIKSKVQFLSIISAVLFVCGGCVSSGTYQAKEQEFQLLSKNLEETKGAHNELQEKSKKLSEENAAMILKLKKLSADFAELKADNEKLKLENEKLTAAAKPENLLKTLLESFSNLQAENQKLKQALAVIEKAAVKKEPAVPVQLNPVIIKPSVTVDDSTLKKEEVPVDTATDPLKPATSSAEKTKDLKNEELKSPLLDDKALK